MNQIGMKEASPASMIDAASAVGQYLDQNELREAFRKLWRRRNLVFVTMALLSIITLVILIETKPRFTGTALVMVVPREQHVVNVQDVIQRDPRDTDAVFNEIEVLTSRKLVGRLIDKLNLASLKEFNPTLRPPSLMAKLSPVAWLPGEWVAVLSPGHIEPTPEEKREIERNLVIDSVLKRLKVAPRARSEVVAIEFQSESRELAARGANSLAELYQTSQLEEKFEATQQVTGWLNERLAELRRKTDESEHAVEAYRASAGLLNSTRSVGTPGSRDVTLVEQQISDQTVQLSNLRAERATAESRLRQAKDAQSKANGQDSFAEVLDSPLIQRLQEQEAEIGRNIADLSQQYGERHPKLIAARAQYEDIHTKIQAEVRKIMIGLENSANIARAREGAIIGQIDELKKQVIAGNSAQVKLHELEMDSSTNRTVYDTFLARFKETSAQSMKPFDMPDARVISAANIPRDPSFPNIPLVMLVELFGSCVVGILLALLVEHLDRGFRSGVQFEHETGTPVLAMLPEVEESKGRASDYLVDRPMSAYAEAVRSVYTSLLLTQGSEKLRTIVVSSCQPSEGKTTLSVSLARMMAGSGQKVILVEADLRRPSVHQQLGLERGIGLAEVLVGSVSLEDALYRDPKTTADILLAGKETLNPSRLLASHQMDELLARLAREYDAVIIDTAPVLAVSDGLLLANKADGTIYSCRWATTSRETAALGLKELRDANARIVGAVISVVNTKKSRTYGYADTSYYYYSRKYYTEGE